MRKHGRLLVRDIIIDPARGRELINPEFSTDNAFFLLRNDRGEVGGRYDALPAAVAAEPTAFGCVVGDRDGESGSPTLIAILWDGVAARFHKPSPVVGSTTTVAEAGGAPSASGGGQGE